MIPLAIGALAIGTIAATGGAAAPAVAAGAGGAGVAGAGGAAAGGGFLSSMAPWLFGGSMGLSAIGSVGEANAAASAGKAQEANQRFIAAQLDRNAGQERAASQRRVAEIARQGRFAQSRALAVGAASGGGVSNPGFVDLISDMEREIETRKSLVLSEGEMTAQDLNLAAESRRRSGAYDRKAGNQQRSQTLIGGAADLGIGTATLFDRYG